MLGSATVPVTGGWETFANVTGTVTGAPAGTTTLYLTFTGGTGALFDMDAFTFNTGARHRRHRPDPRAWPSKCLDVRSGATADGTQDPALHLQRHRRADLDAAPARRCGRSASAWTSPAAPPPTARKIQLWTCNGTGAQNWAPQADGSLRNPQSGKCLDVVRQQLRRRHAVVHLWTCTRRRQPEVDPALTPIGDPQHAMRQTHPDRARRVAAAAAVIAVHGAAGPAVAADAPYDVLVFSKTAGFRHDSIPAGIQAIRDLGAANSFTVTATEDANAFTTANLAQYEAVVFLNTTGDVLNASQQTAFESYIRAGGGYVGVHAAADTEYDWPFYGNLVGAYFASHPAIQQANVKVEDRAHAATAHLPQTWTRTDEWYNYRTNPRSTAHVLATLDESSYSGGGDGRRPPASPGARRTSGGRSFYTGGGHTQAVVRRGRLPRAPARRHPVRGRPDQGRLPAGDRLHRRSTTARPPAGRRPGRAASPTPTPR